MDFDLNPADFQTNDGFGLDLINSALPDLDLIILLGISLQLSLLFPNYLLLHLFCKFA